MIGYSFSASAPSPHTAWALRYALSTLGEA